MRTVGVDLAAEAKGTAVAVVEWPRTPSPTDARATLADLRIGADDEAVLAALEGADKAALDCPLGWPEPFTEFVVAHRTGHVLPPLGVDGLAWRRTLSRRTTDHECLVCALVARAAALGTVTGPAEHQLEVAAREGWIVLPTAPITALLPG